MCTINKSAHTKKSLETYCMHLVYLPTNKKKKRKKKKSGFTGWRNHKSNKFSLDCSISVSLVFFFRVLITLSHNLIMFLKLLKMISLKVEVSNQYKHILISRATIAWKNISSPKLNLIAFFVALCPVVPKITIYCIHLSFLFKSTCYDATSESMKAK